MSSGNDYSANFSVKPLKCSSHEDRATVGNYVIQGKIGQGGFGIIYRVRSQRK